MGIRISWTVGVGAGGGRGVGRAFLVILDFSWLWNVEKLEMREIAERSMEKEIWCG